MHMHTRYPLSLPEVNSKINLNLALVNLGFTQESRSVKRNGKIQGTENLEEVLPVQGFTSLCVVS